MNAHKSLTIITCLLFASLTKAQPAKDTTVFICNFPEVVQFPGGNDSLKTYVRRNLKWPGPGWDKEGTVYVKFKVDCKGHISDAKIIRGIDSLANKEALRLVNDMPAWTGGNCDRYPNPLWYNLPIRFRFKE